MTAKESLKLKVEWIMQKASSIKVLAEEILEMEKEDIGYDELSSMERLYDEIIDDANRGRETVMNSYDYLEKE